jgi:hypothetical protein
VLFTVKVVTDANDRQKLVNTKGEIIFEAPENTFLGAYQSSKHFDCYQPNGFRGLLSSEGKLLAEMKYKSIATGKDIYLLINNTHLAAKQLTEADVEALLTNAEGYFILTKKGDLVKL